ncbi:MAG: hypothetical protein ACKPKO_48220, partial [Candidatus Fonsibacter sp.]
GAHDTQKYEILRILLSQRYCSFTKSRKIPAAHIQNVELITAHIGGSADPLWLSQTLGPYF